MISVEMEDVLAVLQLCKPYIIGIIAALVIGIVIMIACRRMSRDKRFLIRGEAAIAMVLAVVFLKLYVHFLRFSSRMRINRSFASRLCGNSSINSAILRIAL